jgi:subtilisin family serine protease
MMNGSRHMGQALVLAMLVGASATQAMGQNARPGNRAVTPQWGPDRFGGYASSHIIVQVKPGITPAQLPDGSWTFTAAQGQPAQDQAIAPALARRNVSSITPIPRVAPANKALAQQLGLDRYYMISVSPGSDTPAMATEFAAFNQVFDRAMIDPIGGLATVPNDSDFSLQWNMHNTGQSGGTADADVDAPECWDIHQGLPETIVAVLDTGVQQNYEFDPTNPGDAATVEHPELAGKVISGWDFNDGNGNTSDYHGHGTHCAGTIAALANNGTGIAGLNWNAQILAVKVVNNSGSGSATTAADGVTFATDNGADIISMSLQYYNLAAGHPLETAVAYAYDSGVLPIAAAGNFQAPGTIAYPAKFAKCMAIGATNHNDLKWSGSNTGPEIDITAPGQAVYSLWKNSGNSTQSGTSMATPHVAALASLIVSYNPDLTLTQVEAIIRNTAEDKGVEGFDTSYGWGRINANAALLAAAPVCAGDITGDRAVDVNDLLAAISSWGFCPSPPASCPADIAPKDGGDGTVNIDDLLLIVTQWGACP